MTENNTKDSWRKKSSSAKKAEPKYRITIDVAEDWGAKIHFSSVDGFPVGRLELILDRVVTQLLREQRQLSYQLRHSAGDGPEAA